MPSGRIQFEDFALDRDRFELLRDGRSIKLEKLPMELLILLVERGGHLVTRQEIIDRLWGREVFVDTEHGINTAIFKLRTIFGDDAGQSRFIQTVTGKGYRFVAPIAVTSSGSNGGTVVATPAAVPDGVPASDEPQPLAPPRRRSIPWFTAGCVVAALAVGGAFWRLHLGASRASSPTTAAQIHSLAVLPLENLSGDSGQDYFADGMTDEIITMLARNTGMRVISRTSAMQFKNTRLSLPEVARQLGVDGVLEGSVGRTGNRVHVNVQLVYAPTDTHVWAESYNRELSDLGALENQLATTIAEQVGLTVSSPSTPATPIKPEAHDAYLWGRYYWFGGSDKSGEYFQKAVNLQPDYAAAWSGLADSLIVQAVTGDILPEKVVDRAEFAARKAVALDPQLGDAHRSMAAINLFDHWDYAAAERESLRAVELAPRDSENHHFRSYVLEVLNRKDEALQEEKLANELDPRLRPLSMGRLLIRLHRYDDAIHDVQTRIEGGPGPPGLHQTLSDAYRLKAMDKESAEELAKAFTLGGNEDEAKAARRAFTTGGMKAVLEWQLAQAQEWAGEHYLSPYVLALSNARLKRKEETLRFLERAYQQRASWMVFLRDEPDFDFVHSEPRYRAIVEGMKLPDHN